METLSALHVLCDGNPLATDGFPAISEQMVSDA